MLANYIRGEISY